MQVSENDSEALLCEVEIKYRCDMLINKEGGERDVVYSKAYIETGLD